MDYSKLTDQEINMLVAKIQHPDKNFIESKTRPPSVVLLNHINNWVDYCNNPEDAWPIIAKCKIDISWGDNTPAPDEWGYADARCLNSKLDEFEHYEKSGNALRAAMIAFLKMQDANHV